MTPLKHLFFVLAILACGRLQAGSCVPDTLANYVLLGATGCTVGTLTAFNFGFSVLGSSGLPAPVPLTSSQINVTPSFGGPNQLGGVNFASTGFSVIMSQSIQYLITYTWDPHDDIESMDDIMDPPSAILGFANITTVGCAGAAFSGLGGTTCSTGLTTTVTVFDNNGTTQLKDRKDITPTQILGIRTTIDLEAMGGSASFDSIGSDSLVPEPATWWCSAAALTLLAARLRRIRARLHP